MDNFDNFFGSLFLEKDENQYVSTSTPELLQLTSCLTGSENEISVKDSNDLASTNLNLDISEIGNDLVSIFNDLNLENENTNNTIITTATTEQPNTEENILGPKTAKKMIKSKVVYSSDIAENTEYKIQITENFEDSESDLDDTSEEISSDEDLDNNNTLEVTDRNFSHLNHEIQNENYDNNFINDDDNVDPLDVIENNNNNNHIAEIVLDLRDLIINIDYDWDELDMILSDEDLDVDEDYNNNSL